MFLSFLLWRAYLKKHSVFTAFHTNLLCKLVSTLIPLKLLRQAPLISMLLNPGDVFQSFVLLDLPVMSPLLAALATGMPSSCGRVSFSSTWLSLLRLCGILAQISARDGEPLHITWQNFVFAFFT